MFVLLVFREDINLSFVETNKIHDIMNIESFSRPIKPSDIRREIEEGTIEFLEIQREFAKKLRREFVDALFNSFNSAVHKDLFLDDYSASNFIKN